MKVCQQEDDILGYPAQMEHPQRLSPLTLAFLGDAVYELMVRHYLTMQGSMPAHLLHQKAVELVRCSAQAQAYRLLEEHLHEDELAILKRGRNNSSVKSPKNADPIEYRMATGVEALFGYLFLSGEQKRLEQLFQMILSKEIQPAHKDEQPDTDK